MPVSVEDLFTRWCQHGDRSALAQVFDRTAPEVWSLALHLGGDRAAADDLVQATFLSAMESARGYRRGAPLLPWLLGILANRVRMQRRRARKEQAQAAREGGETDPVAAAEAAELRAMLRDAVARLPEAYRSALVLQFEHGLSAAEIAHALGRRRGTVRSQLSRGIEMLRALLPAALLAGCGRAADLPELAAVRERVLAAAVDSPWSVVGGGTLMLAKKIAVAVFVVLACAVWGVSRGRPDVTTEPAQAALPLDRGPAALRADAPRPAAPGARTAVPPPRSEQAPATTGSLAVHVVYDDGEPAAGVHLTLRRRGSDIRVGLRRALTDGEGRASFDELAPGTALLRADRAYWSRPHDRADIVAGQTASLTLTIPVHMQVEGAVVDAAGLPIAGAEVVLAPLAASDLDAERATTSGPDGRFTLRVAYEHCSIGARADGHAPSAMHFLQAPRGGSVRATLVLPGPGGAVEGTVTDHGGAPVRAAVVRIGTGRLDAVPGDEWGGPALAAQVDSDGEGRFRAIGLPPGEHPVVVRAVGLASWTGRCEFTAGTVARLAVTLPEGCTLRGTVRDETGAPLADAWIECGERGALTHQRVLSAADGSFVLDGLPGGAAVRATHHEAGETSTRFEGAPTQVSTWDPVLTRGIVLRGRVLTAENEPARGVRVEARARTWAASASSASDGSFAILGCPRGELLDLRTHGGTAEDVVLEGVDPLAGEVLMRVRLPPEPSARLVGRVLDPEGKTAAAVQVFVRDLARSPQWRTVWSDADGAFEFPRLHPATYQVMVHTRVHPDLVSGPFEVSDRSSVDVGTLRLERGGTILVRLATPIDDLELHILDASGGPCTVVPRRVSPLRTTPLRPGSYQVRVRGRERAERTLPVEVRSGEESVVDVR